MKLLFLGVSSALSVGDKQYQSNMIIETLDGKRMLFDCGSDVKHSLYEQGISCPQVDAVYISHLHADHAGGLEWFGFSKYFLEKKRPSLYISPDQKDTLWNHVLSGGMSCLEDFQPTLSTYFDVKDIQQNQFSWENHSFQLIKVPHSISNHQYLPAYGLLITGDKKTIFISSDTRYCPEILEPIYRRADLIFHDCETSSFKSEQHPHYDDLKKLDMHIKNKMWLYHYNAGELSDAQKDGFLGFVSRGQTFEF